jgi:hypothetical protein
VKFWDPVTGQERLTLRHDGREPSSLAFSPDGRMLAVTWGIGLGKPVRPSTVILYRAPEPGT